MFVLWLTKSLQSQMSFIECFKELRTEHSRPQCVSAFETDVA